MADEVFNEFDTDTHRRVCANLSVPRSAGELAAFLSKYDPHVSADAYGEGSIEEYLKDLEADGLVKNIGVPGDAAKAIRALKDDGDLVTLPKPKADNLVERAEREDAHPFFDSGDHWVMTQLALDKINGPIPNEPPALSGAALKHAKAENERLQKESDERARDGLLKAAKALREQAEKYEKEANGK